MNNIDFVLLAVHPLTSKISKREKYTICTILYIICTHTHTYADIYIYDMYHKLYTHTHTHTHTCIHILTYMEYYIIFLCKFNKVSELTCFSNFFFSMGQCTDIKKFWFYFYKWIYNNFKFLLNFVTLCY